VGRRHGNQFCGIIAHPNACVNSTDDVSTSCKNFVNYGPLTPEMKELICELLARHNENLRIQPNTSEYTASIFSKFSGLVDIWMMSISLIFVSLSLKVRCYSNQLMLRESNEHQLTPPAFFALAFQN